MSFPRPFQRGHSHADIIWPYGPFKKCVQSLYITVKIFCENWPFLQSWKIHEATSLIWQVTESYFYHVKKCFPYMISRCICILRQLSRWTGQGQNLNIFAHQIVHCCSTVYWTAWKWRVLVAKKLVNIAKNVQKKRETVESARRPGEYKVTWRAHWITPERIEATNTKVICCSSHFKD